MLVFRSVGVVREVAGSGEWVGMVRICLQVGLVGLVEGVMRIFMGIGMWMRDCVVGVGVILGCEVVEGVKTGTVKSLLDLAFIGTMIRNLTK